MRRGPLRLWIEDALRRECSFLLISSHQADAFSFPDRDEIEVLVHVLLHMQNNSGRTDMRNNRTVILFRFSVNPFRLGWYRSSYPLSGRFSLVEYA
jgi:hypothetical protein